jgi:hypothetical protein
VDSIFKLTPDGNKSTFVTGIEASGGLAFDPAGKNESHGGLSAEWSDNS